MDTHLTTLQATLSSIAQLQRPLFTHPAPQPFTLAFLDDPSSSASSSSKRDFIRESDAIERRLFHFPPIGGSGLEEEQQTGGNTGQISTTGGIRETADEDPSASPSSHVDSLSDEVFLRKPQVRSVAVPTPLRPSTTSGDKSSTRLSKAVPSQSQSQSTQYDARSLLIAAQRLNDNYQHGPRTRKHIKTLLKQAKDSISQSQIHNDRIVKLEKVLALLASGTNVDDIGTDQLRELLGVDGLTVAQEKKPSTSASSSTRIRELRKRTEEIKAQLNREEMEVLALEEMREEVMAKRQQLRHKQSKAQIQTQPATRQPPAKTRPSLSPARKTTAPPRPSVAHIASQQSSPRGAASSSTSAAATITKPATKATSSAPKPPPRTGPAAARARLSRLPPRVPTAVGGGAGNQARPSVPKGEAGASPAAHEIETVRHQEKGVTSHAEQQTSPPSQAPSQPLAPPPSSESDVTIRAASTSAPVHTTDPEPTDELERLTEKIWDTFGDHLRYFNPFLESADFLTTLSLLRKCINSGSGAADTVEGNGSVSGSSSANSASSGTALSTAPPTKQSAISSWVLLNLLTAPPPDHSVDFGELKARGKQWSEERQQANSGGQDEEVMDGEQATTSAVYALVAKRLLKIKRTGGPARVGFGS